MVYQKHSRVTMEDNLHLMKWNLFLKSMVLPTLELHRYDPKLSQVGQLERINRVIKKAIQSAINKGRNWQHELDTFLLSYRNTPHCTTGETPSFLLFSRIVRDKLPTVPGPIDASRHDDAVKRNRA